MEQAQERNATLRARRQTIARDALNRRRARSVLTPSLRALRDYCEQRGVELVVVALPIDVQVSAAEWEKYDGAQPVDMSASMSSMGV